MVPRVQRDPHHDRRRNHLQQKNYLLLLSLHFSPFTNKTIILFCS
jgi:hypothetical protein